MGLATLHQADELDEGARLWETVAAPLGDRDWQTLALTANHQGLGGGGDGGP